MLTRITTSTITYNTPQFLKLKCDELIEEGKIDFYAFVPHKKESDELKDHNHLMMIPSCQIDTKKMDIHFEQPTSDNEKSLGTCTIWKTVGKHTSDWILYCLHDLVYCRAKGYNDRLYTYNPEDFYVSSRDGFNELVFEAYHSSQFYYDKQIRERVFNAQSHYGEGINLVKNGYIPMKEMCSFHHFLQMIDG